MSDLTRESGVEDVAEKIRLEMARAGITDLFDVNEIRRGLGRFCALSLDASSGDSVNDLIQWLDDKRAENHIFAKREGLNTLAEWKVDEKGHLSHVHAKFFRVIGLKVTSPFREVMTWSQPILDNEGEGIIGLLLRKVSGSTHFLMQAKADVGNRNIVQLGPTVQFNPGNYIDNEKLAKPFLFEEFISPEKSGLISESRQAEEGGRFYQEEHLHRILMLPDDLPLCIPPNYRWCTLGEIRFLLHLGDAVNSSARSILACLL